MGYDNHHNLPGPIDSDVVLGPSRAAGGALTTDYLSGTRQLTCPVGHVAGEENSMRTPEKIPCASSLWRTYRSSAAPYASRRPTQLSHVGHDTCRTSVFIIVGG